MLVSMSLDELGYKALEASDGPSVLRILQSPQRVDLLITDIGLPGLNGRQVADAARVVRPDLKVLFMTGYAENAVAAQGHSGVWYADHHQAICDGLFAKRIRELMDAGDIFAPVIERLARWRVRRGGSAETMRQSWDVAVGPRNGDFSGPLPVVAENDPPLMRSCSPCATHAGG